MDTHDVFHDPHLTARGFVQQVEHPVHGSVLLLDKPFRLQDPTSRCAPRPCSAPTPTPSSPPSSTCPPTTSPPLRTEGVIA